MSALIMLAVALSLDSFGVGLTYGMRRIKIPLLSLLFIAACSGASILIAMSVGTALSAWLSPQFAEATGAIILIVIGCWALFETYRPKKERVEKSGRTGVDFTIRMFGFVIHILRDPETADIDSSGTVTGKEAFLLGLALSLDAFGAGIAAALMGFSPVGLALSVAVLSALFVSLGTFGGYQMAHLKWVRRMSFIPGLLLIIIGVLKL
ncbi:sporulation membrane protein YtaF [Bacillus sp. JCM 19041]|uniref:sporulation membrane protein YtaF n=1 Tax=Bacillus sp. JCM 19041 TaxID=1460637 RepID=UPI000A7EECCA